MHASERKEGKGEGKGRNSKDHHLRNGWKKGKPVKVMGKSRKEEAREPAQQMSRLQLFHVS